jgi:hypothetical protein
MLDASDARPGKPYSEAVADAGSTARVVLHQRERRSQKPSTSADSSCRRPRWALGSWRFDLYLSRVDCDGLEVLDRAVETNASIDARVGIHVRDGRAAQRNPHTYLEEINRTADLGMRTVWAPGCRSWSRPVGRPAGPRLRAVRDYSVIAG